MTQWLNDPMAQWPNGSIPNRLCLMSFPRRTVGVLLSVLGVALLVWQVERVGLGNVGDALGRVGWGFLGILALSFLRFALRSVAWVTIIGDRVPLTAAIAATVGGDAAGTLTPLSLLVSEPAKSLYLGGRVPPARSFAALTAENFFYSVSVALFIVLGTAVLLADFALQPEVRWAAWLSLSLMAAVLAGALWIGWREPAVVSGVLRRVPFVNLERLIERVREFETRTYTFARQTHGRLGIVVLCEVGFHVLSFGESLLTLWLLTGVWAPLPAFVLDTFNRIVNVVFRMVPLKVGVDEYSTGLIAPIVGFNPVVGVSIALVRKGRVLAWAVAGVALLIRRGLSVRRLARTGGTGTLFGTDERPN